MTCPARVLIASNRLPFTVCHDGGEITLKAASGGLTAALGAVHRTSGSLWIGWPGECAPLDASERAALAARLRMDHVVPVDVSNREAAEYYDGICNTVLWPTLHYLVDRIPVLLPDFAAYRTVNERFADALVAEYQPGDAIWIHDYHLMLVPALVRGRIPDAAIGYFLHTPFPAADVFRILPWRCELLDGILGATLIGLQTERDVHNFGDTLRQVTDYQPSAHAVISDGREIRFGAYPVGIDPARLESVADMDEPYSTTASTRSRRLFVGIDRLDYTKGISRRLAAFERLLEQHPSLVEEVELLQIAVPSREHVPSYQSLKDELQEQVATVNRRFATPGWTPVSYHVEAVPAEDLPAIYRAADVMLVTSIRDGMNLVAKEFVSSRHDEDGVLVLSELAGAAEQLREALLVNPYSVEDLAATMLTALSLDGDDRRLRMRALREEVFSATADRWMERFLSDLTAPVIDECTACEHVVRSVTTTVNAGKDVVLVLSYDAALDGVGSVANPSGPDAELSQLLDALSQRPGIELHLVSGADHDMLDSWLPFAHAVLWAEDGIWRRERHGRRWRRMPWVMTDWKEDVRDLLDRFVARTPGAIVDEQGAALRWHYGRCDRIVGRSHAQTLAAFLREGSAAMGYTVTDAADVIIVRPVGCSLARTLETIVDGCGDSAHLVVFDGPRPAAATRRVLRARDLLVSVGGTHEAGVLPLTEGRLVRSILSEMAYAMTDRPLTPHLIAPQDWMMMPLRTA